MKFDHRFHLIEKAPSMRLYEEEAADRPVRMRLDEEEAADRPVRMRLDFFDHMLRVALLRPDVPLLPTWSVCPGDVPPVSEGESSGDNVGRPVIIDVPLEGRDKLSTEGFLSETLVTADFTATKGSLPDPPGGESSGVFADRYLFFTLSGVDFSVDLHNFRITAHTPRGVLYRDRSGLAYNFDGELGRGSVHYTDRFEGERIYGLGDKSGPVNKAGRRYVLAATDSMGFSAASSDPLYKQIPFYICEHAAGAYGIYYDTYSNGSIDFGAEHDNYFEPFHVTRFDEENMVFYLILGTPREIVRRFNALCGGIAPVPEWAFRYCGSTMEYTDASDADARLRGFLTRCAEHGIRPGGFYLSSGYTQIGEQRCVFHWNTDKIPSPEGLAEAFAAQGAALIPNVKPAFLTTHPLYETIAERGWFLHYPDGRPAQMPFWGGMASYLDFTHPDAYAFWKECVRRQLVDKGYRNIWNDNNEYDVLDESVLADGFGRPVPAVRIRPLFSYLMARASREACKEAQDGLPFHVSRCAIAGTQRVATTWTGDNYTSFPELRANHRQIMTMALTGFSFFGPDIGGFAGPRPGEELFLRWLQYGVFLPRFVLHSWKPGEPSTMPWLYPELMPAVRRLFDLREQLVPYLFAETERRRAEHAPLLEPVFLRDPAYDVESDCFLCGDRYLVCPVFDEGAESVTVTLPAIRAEAVDGQDPGSPDVRSNEAFEASIGRLYAWKLRGSGPSYFPGDCVTVSCLPTDLPVWFEAV